MAKTSSITLKTSAYGGRYVQAVLTQTKNIETNKNEIRYVISSLGGTYNYYATGPITLRYRKVNSDGTYGSWVTLKTIARVDYTGQASPAFPCSKGSIADTTEIEANNDGTYTMEVSLSAAIYDSTQRVTTSTWEMEDIPRAAAILTADNFTDEDNPTITYSNPAGSVVDSVQVGILDIDGGVQYAKYREISKTDSTYTFELTDEERAVLLEAIQDDTDNKPGEVYVRFYIKTYINGEIVDEPKYLQRIVSVANAIPELSVSATDVGAASTALTKDGNTIIKGFNYITASMTPTLKKGATIVDQSIINGNTIENKDSAIFENVDINTFIFRLTDSYGQTVEKTKTMSLVEYIKLTCNIKVNNPTADGDLAFRISGNYFNDKFGQNGVNNTLTIQYRLKENDGNYSNWISVTPTITDNTYTVAVIHSDLNYRSAYTVQARAIDKIQTAGINSVERKVKSIPIFDWGEEDFAFNVPVNIDGELTVQGDTNIDGNFTVNGEPLISNQEILNLVYPVGSTYISQNNENPSSKFGGTWEQMRTFYGGELIAFAAVQASGGTSIANTTATGFGAAATGTKTHKITNYIDGILSAGNGAIKVQTKGIVGMIDANMSISGLGSAAGCRGIWFMGNNNELPANVDLLPGNGMNGLYTGPYGANYGGAAHDYIYKVDTDEDIEFYVNPKFEAYGSAMQLSQSGTGCFLLVKAYARHGTSYMWKRIS